MTTFTFVRDDVVQQLLTNLMRAGVVDERELSELYDRFVSYSTDALLAALVRSHEIVEGVLEG